MRNKKKFQKFQNTFKKRTITIFAICLMVIVVFAVRMIWLYNSEYRTKAAEQRLKTIEIPAKRGDIVDTNGNVLAESVKVNALYYIPEKLSTENKNKLTNGLSKIMDLNSEKIDDIISSESTYKISNSISKEQVKEIRSLELNCLTISVENQRYYPGESSLSSILGFVDPDSNGLYGIEKYYDDELKGQPGLNIYAGTREGNISTFDKNEELDAEEGKNIQLNIDENINAIVSNVSKEAFEIYNPKSISVIVTEPMTNKVVAMENFPRYDSNNPREGRTDEEKEEIKDLSEGEKLEKYYDIWRNISISNTYEPGSVFKLITTAMALEENTSTDSSIYRCDGIYRDIPGVQIKCIRWYDPHGNETLEEALANSCNPAYIQIAKEIGYAKFYEYIKSFGFGEATGIDLIGEEKGIVPKSADDITITQLATMSYGHGIAVTPIQMITASNALVNGGKLIEPRIVKDEKKNEKTKVKRQVISEETSKKMISLMQNTVENGSANAVKSSNYKVGGKSGTTIKIENGEYTSEITVTSFYSVFPVDDPKYSVLVVVDEPQGLNSGNAVSGKISKKINDEIVKYKNLEDHNYNSLGKNSVVVPDVVGLTLKNAVVLLEKNNLKADIVNTSLNDSIIITNQSIESGTEVEENTTIDLKADDSGTTLIKVPDIIGLNSREVNYETSGLNIKIKSTGDMDNGKVLKTIPSVGEFVEPGSTLEIIYNKE